MNSDFIFKDPSYPDGIYRKHADATRVIELDWAPALANYWAPGRGYSSGDYVRPRKPTGFAYLASGSGVQSSNREPRWPSTLSGTVVDGNITWTAVEAGANGLRGTPASPTVAVDPTGDLAAASVSLVHVARVQMILSGGSNGGGSDVTLEDGTVVTCYKVSATITAGNETLVGSLLVEIVPR